MYEVPGEHRPGCRDAWVLTLAMLLVVAPVVAAFIAILSAIVAAVYLFTIHPALSLLPFVVVVAGVLLYARWDQRAHRPPGL